jgi:hypothetical protein
MVAIAKKTSFSLVMAAVDQGRGALLADLALLQAHPHLVLMAIHRAPPGHAR